MNEYIHQLEEERDRYKKALEDITRDNSNISVEELCKSCVLEPYCAGDCYGAITKRCRTALGKELE